MDTSLSLLARLADAPADHDWQALDDLYRPLLLRWATRAGVPAVDADDLAQDVLMVVSAEVAGFVRHGEGAFRGWLRVILANRLKEFFRKRDRQSTAELDELESPGSALSAAWDREHDRHVAGQLLLRVQGDFAPTTFRAFRLHVLDGVPAADVAAELGLSLNAVLLAKSRILKRLREEARALIDGAW